MHDFFIRKIACHGRGQPPTSRFGHGMLQIMSTFRLTRGDAGDPFENSGRRCALCEDFVLARWFDKASMTGRSRGTGKLGLPGK